MGANTPDAGQLAVIGWARLDAGDPRGAVQEFKAALADNAEHVNALVGLCQALLDCHETAEAAEQVQALLRIAPRLPSALRLNAAIMQRRGRFDEALGSANEAIALDLQEPLGYHIAAACLCRLSRRRDALKLVAEGLKFAPTDAILLAQQAQLTLETRGAVAAAPMIEAALMHRLDDDYVLIIAGEIFLALGRLDEARSLLAEALSHDANSEGAIALYLLTDRRRYRVLRAVMRFRYWRQDNMFRAAVWWGAWIGTVCTVGVLLAATHVSAGLFAIGYGLFWRWQYREHYREVQAHFLAPELKAGF